MDKEKQGLSDINIGSLWFRRFYKEAKKLSPYLRFRRIKHGFWRIYWKQAYIGECYQEMPMIGHDIEEPDMRFENQKYYEEYEDNAELTRKIKNFREGYYDSINRLRKKVWLMKHNKEYNQRTTNAYKNMRII